MTDHITLAVKDLKKSKEYYDNTLSCLGYECLYSGEYGEFVGAAYARTGKKSFEFGLMQVENRTGKENHGKFENPAGLHIGFGAPDEKSVDQWYKKCIALGGKDNGKPGYRMPDHYAAYIIDPNGWHTEACFHVAK